jgi:hypothetical protein
MYLRPIHTFPAMLPWIVFCFLWDDPLFNPTAPDPWLGRGFNDEEFRQIRRENILIDLETLYIRIEKYRRRAGYWAWCCQQLRERISQHTPIQGREQWLEVVETLTVDAEVQKTLDFDFGRWFDEFDRGDQQ